MNVSYIACAKSSAIDGQTNQLSLFHLVDEIRSVSFPLRIDTLCIATLFERGADDPAVMSYVLAISLDAVLIASFTMSVDFSKSRRNRTVNTIQGLSIPGTGALTVAILHKAKTLAVWPAMVLDGGDGTPVPAPEAPAPTKEIAPRPNKAAAALN